MFKPKGRLISLQALKKENEEVIGYASVEKVILDSQLAIHRNFLSSFKTLFRQFDTGRHGYITQSQLYRLMDEIDPENNFDRKHLIESIGFTDQKIVNFSELVNHFSSQFISRDEETINLLQFIYLMSSDD